MFKCIPKREQGQGLVEYALIIALVTIVVIGILFLLGPQLTLAYAKVIAALNGAGSYDYSITSFSVTTDTPVPNSCRYRAQGSVAVKQNGVAVGDGTKVIGVVSGNPSMTVSANTSGGSASFNVTETVSGSCPSSGSATLIFGGSTATANY